MDQIGSAEVGGVEAYTFRLGEALQERGHQVTLFGGLPKKGRTFYQSGLSLQLFPYIETSNIPNFGTRFRRLVQRLHFAWGSHKTLLQQKFDAVFIFKPYDLITAWNWRRRGSRSRIIASIHGPEFYPGDRLFVSSIDAIYAVSASTAKAVQDHYHQPCPVIPNFIDLKKFPYLDRATPSQEKWLITVGRLVGWKGVSSLIQSFAEVYSKIPESRLAIFGEGPEKTGLQQQAEQLGLSSVVQFPGIISQESLKEFYKRAWLFIQPSIGYESFSISALEALASGLSVLVSDQVGIADWFQSSEGIEIYPSKNPYELTRRICTLLTQSWNANLERGRKARSVVEKEFASAQVVSKIEQLCF